MLLYSVVDPGCLFCIQDPTFSIPDPEYRVDKNPDPDPHERN
jgi:hypothetical protein